MATATNSITISRPPAEVYRYLADGLNNPEWRSAVTEISLASGTGGMVGATYKQGLKGPFGRTVAGDYRLVEATPPSRIRFEVVSGPARPVGEFALVPVDGGTRVTFTLSLEVTGIMRLMSGMIQGSMNGEVANLSTLKAVLERGPPSA